MLTKQKILHHMTHLQEQHRDLDTRIHAMDSYGSHLTEYLQLKKKKLQLRDKIEYYKHQLLIM